MKSGLTHLDDKGRARMVDVGGKPVTARMARARARVEMQAETLEMITRGTASKGDVLAVARVAGIMAAKRTHELIPLCHPLPLSEVAVEFAPDPAAAAIDIDVIVRLEARTGAEMEALTAASIAALTIYDMCKAVDRGMTITRVRLVEKSGGKSGDYRRDGA